MDKYYNSKVRNTILKLGYLVYRSNKSSRVEDTGNLVPKGEGPSRIMEALGDGAYTLQNR
ncbi:hypothetical protein Tco_0717814, partial [Tanacetum coccineum]